jgi:uncharacterized protein YbbK (DUF523 family)/uncharacterized protein YbgA (DUF1722 family)
MIGMTARAPIRIGVSACLLGQQVRHDGRHKRDDFLVDQLARFVEWVPVCPEVEIGMGVPRESVRLVRIAGQPHMRGTSSQTDWTDTMTAYARAKVAALATLGLSGYVLKSKSPSCGMQQIPLDDGSGVSPVGVGLFATQLLAVLPNLPVEEEGRLGQAGLRDNFLERVFAHARLRKLWSGPWGASDLIAFHQSERLALLAHSALGARKLERLVAEAPVLPLPQLQQRYESGFMTVLRELTTPGRHARVLHLVLRQLGAGLDRAARNDLQQLIDDHRRGRCPLAAPLAALGEQARRLAISSVLGQSYLAPYPPDLMPGAPGQRR